MQKLNDSKPDVTEESLDAAANLRLGGNDSSGGELELARHTAELLERLLPQQSDDGDAAQQLHDLGQLLLHPLDEPGRALSVLRAAHQRRPSVYTARAYRKAALRSDSSDDILASLESEARLGTSPPARATLEVARGSILAGLGNAAAARQAFEAAIVAAPTDLTALAALLELDQSEGQLAAAAERARSFAEAINDEQVKADVLALSARLAERAGRLDAARATLVQSELHAARSLPAIFLGERLLPETQPRALVGLIEAQIADGSLSAGAGWLEIGQYARYLLDDQELALRAFEQAVEHLPAADVARGAALSELAELLALSGQAAAAAPLEEERVALEKDPLERALSYTRIGVLHEELGDLPGAAAAFGAAVEAAPAYLPALEGAGRSYGRLGDSDRLLKIHLAEAEQPSSPADRATALRRAGELLVADPERAEMGIGYLTEASRIAPDHAGITLSLERALRKRRDFPALCALYERELEHTTEPRRRAGLNLQIGALKADQLGDTRGALVAYRAAAAIPGGAPDHALVTLARLLDESGELAELEPVLAELTSLTEDPVQMATLYERAATLREQRGDVDGAVATYLTALPNAPASHSIQAAAGRAFARAGRWDALLGLYERATHDGSPAARASYGYKLAVVLAKRLGRLDEGIAQLERVRAERPEHLPSLVLLASLYTEHRKWTELRPLLATLPKSPARCVQRALLAESLGHLDEALELWRDPQLAQSVAATRATERLLARLGQWATLADAYERRAFSSDVTPAAAVVARYRAAELRAERTSELDRAAALLRDALVAQPESIPLRLALVRATPPADPARPELLESLAERVQDPALRAALQAQLVAVDSINDDDRLMALSRLLTLVPRDPVASLQLEALLESRRLRAPLVSLLRTVQRDPKMDDGVVAAASARLGLLLEELGSSREAIDAYELAASASHASLLALVALPRLYRAIGDSARVRGALEALAAAMPAAAERAAVLRRLATDQRLAGDKSGAAATLEWALREDPRAFEALRELDEIVGNTAPERIIDALMRALALEPLGQQRLDIGMALASRQLRAGRLEPARETLERVLADDPQHLRAHLLLAELEVRADGWARAATALGAISAHTEAPAPMKREATLKLARLQLEQLSDVAAARTTAQALEGSDLETLDLQLAIARRAEAHDEVARLLGHLIAAPELDDERRADAQLQLAAVQEQELLDVAAAIQTLGEIRLASRRRSAVDRLLDLGGKTGRWDLAAASLEATLDRAGDMEVGWEIAIRRRLASLLEGPLGRADAALRQYERIVALDGADVATLERLAELSTGSPAKAIEYHRALLAADPTRLASWRALRTLFSQVADDDGAFLVDAVLEAVGVADEEESYFYKQRRALLGGTLDGVLGSEERALLAPELAQPAFALLHILAPVLHEVFPVDVAAYGADASATYAGPLFAVAERLAKLLSVGGYRIAAVPNRLGPCVEPPSLLFVPRNLEDAAPREQAAVLGELFARLTFDGIVGDPRRATRMSPALVEYLLWAACEATLPEVTGPHRGRAVYEDIKRRVVVAIGSLPHGELAASARAVVDQGAIAGEPLFEAMERIACRAALLCAQDPLLALASWKERAGAAGAGLSVLPAPVRAVLPFVVSAGHLALRRRLGCGVRTGASI